MASSWDVQSRLRGCWGDEFPVFPLTSRASSARGSTRDRTSNPALAIACCGAEDPSMALSKWVMRSLKSGEMSDNAATPKGLLGASSSARVARRKASSDWRCAFLYNFLLGALLLRLSSYNKHASCEVTFAFWGLLEENSSTIQFVLANRIHRLYHLPQQRVSRP